MPSAELGSLDPIQEEIQTKVGHSELRCPGNSERTVHPQQQVEMKNIKLSIQPFVYKSLSNHYHTPAHEMMRCLVRGTWRRRASKKAAIIARQIFCA